MSLFVVLDKLLINSIETRPCSDKKTGKEEVLVWREEGQQLAERGAVVDVVKNIANRIWYDKQKDRRPGRHEGLDIGPRHRQNGLLGAGIGISCTTHGRHSAETKAPK